MLLVAWGQAVLGKFDGLNAGGRERKEERPTRLTDRWNTFVRSTEDEGGCLTDGRSSVTIPFDVKKLCGRYERRYRLCA